jgi:hypothetical protein
MSNVQLKLDEIWKNDKLPLLLSSSSLNVAPEETTWEGEGDVQNGSVVQGKDGGQYEGDVQCEGVVQYEGGVRCGGGNQYEGVVQEEDDVQGKAGGQHEGGIQLQGDVPRGGFVQDKDAVRCEDDIQIQGGVRHRGVVEDDNAVGDEGESEVDLTIVNDELYNNSSDYTHDHNYSSSVVKQKVKKKSFISSKRRKKYLPEWEKKSEARYKTYILDPYGIKQEKFLCWLYYDGTSMHCRLCEKYSKLKNLNGKTFHYKIIYYTLMYNCNYVFKFFSFFKYTDDNLFKLIKYKLFL